MNEMTKMAGKNLCMAASLLSLLALSAPWVIQAATVTVKVVVVQPPPCVVNQNQPIEVNFGEVSTMKVDGSNYRQTISYSLACSGAVSNAMKLQIKGSGALFDHEVLLTNKTGLGIALLHNDIRLPLNRWVNFTYPNSPVLASVPVKAAGVTLTGGEFSAGATLAVDYQ